MNHIHKHSRIFKYSYSAILIAILAALIPLTAGASQIHGHLFFASKMLVGPVHTYLADDPPLIRM